MLRIAWWRQLADVIALRQILICDFDMHALHIALPLCAFERRAYSSAAA
jgi:hypothetical protein